MAEAKGTANAVRLIVLAWKIGDELEETVRLSPDHLEARLDLVRYYVVAPRLVGDSLDKARAHAAEIMSRDPALGHFTTGFIAYHQKQYGPARREFRQALRDARKASTKILALTWLGWLSQETQQYDEAFWAFEKVLSIDPLQLAASYEIGRTAVFCQCRVERGEEALTRYLTTTPTGDMPALDEARKLLSQLQARGLRPAS